MKAGLCFEPVSAKVWEASASVFSTLGRTPNPQINNALIKNRVILGFFRSPRKGSKIKHLKTLYVDRPQKITLFVSAHFHRVLP